MMKINKLFLNGIPIVTYEKNQDFPKPLLFFFHGLTGNKDNLMDRGQVFAELGFFVVAIDAYMHGERVTPYFEEVMARHDSYLEIVNVIIQTAKDSKELYNRYFKYCPKLIKDKVYIFGVSMGAGVGFYLSIILNEVKSLCAVVGSPSFYEYYKQKAKTYNWIKDFKYERDLEHYKALDPLIHHRRLRDVKIFMACGNHDETVPPIYAQQLYKVREKNTKLKMYDTGHMSTNEMMKDAYEFLVKEAGLNEKK